VHAKAVKSCSAVCVVHVDLLFFVAMLLLLSIRHQRIVSYVQVLECKTYKYILHNYVITTDTITRKCRTLWGASLSKLIELLMSG